MPAGGVELEKSHYFNDIKIKYNFPLDTDINFVVR